MENLKFDPLFEQLEKENRILKSKNEKVMITLNERTRLYEDFKRKYENQIDKTHKLENKIKELNQDLTQKQFELGEIKLSQELKLKSLHREIEMKEKEFHSFQQRALSQYNPENLRNEMIQEIELPLYKNLEEKDMEIDKLNEKLRFESSEKNSLKNSIEKLERTISLERIQIESHYNLIIDDLKFEIKSLRSIIGDEPKENVEQSLKMEIMQLKDKFLVSYTRLHLKNLEADKLKENMQKIKKEQISFQSAKESESKQEHSMIKSLEAAIENERSKYQILMLDYKELQSKYSGSFTTQKILEQERTIEVYKKSLQELQAKGESQSQSQEIEKELRQEIKRLSELCISQKEELAAYQREIELIKRENDVVRQTDMVKSLRNVSVLANQPETRSMLGLPSARVSEPIQKGQPSTNGKLEFKYEKAKQKLKKANEKIMELLHEKAVSGKENSLYQFPRYQMKNREVDLPRNADELKGLSNEELRKRVADLF